LWDLGAMIAKIHRRWRVLLALGLSIFVPILLVFGLLSAWGDPASPHGSVRHGNMALIWGVATIVAWCATVLWCSIFSPPDSITTTENAKHRPRRQTILLVGLAMTIAILCLLGGLVVVLKPSNADNGRAFVYVRDAIVPFLICLFLGPPFVIVGFIRARGEKRINARNTAT